MLNAKRGVNARIDSAVIAVRLLLAACQSAHASIHRKRCKFKLSSPAFQDSGSIPQKFTCQGDNVSPELNWSEAPANAQSFALDHG